MKKIIYLVRTEADFERVVCLGITGKANFEQKFIFTGDFSPFYESGIKNIFQKELFHRNQFKMIDFYEFDIILRLIVNIFNFRYPRNINQIKTNKSSLFKFIAYRLFILLLNRRKIQIVKKILKKENPNFLLTDQSGVSPEYLQEIFRKIATINKIPVNTFTHGAAGGLHSEFSNPVFELYDNYNVFVCNKNETNSLTTNRIVLGDVSSSYTYTHFLNNLKDFEIDFFNSRKNKVAIMMGGVANHTATSGWHIQEEFIIDNGNNPDFAFVVKLHPRETDFVDLRMISQFENVKIVNQEVDRSRVVKWANIVVCSDHCSTIFAPMILGKKVIAIRGKHIPPFKNNFSPLIFSTANFIDNNEIINIDTLKNSNPTDEITNQICWGENGPIDIANKLFTYLK